MVEPGDVAAFETVVHGVNADAGGAESAAVEPEAGGWCWRSAGAAAALGLAPGTAHLYVGRPWRAFFWTAAFLTVCIPTALFLYFFFARTPELFWWIIGIYSVFYLISARRPILDSLLPPRRARIRARGGDRYATVILLGAYSLIVLSGALLEVALFRRACVREHFVVSSRLDPLLREGEKVSVLLSTYVRPVHGEIVLFRGHGAGQDRGADAAGAASTVTLGRVIACPRDAVACRDHALVVNEIGVDPIGAIDRKGLEKAGRRERRKKFLKTLASLLQSDEKSPTPVLVWGREDWEEVSMPPHEFLIVPDVRDDSRSAFAWLVHDEDIVGRVVD